VETFQLEGIRVIFSRLDMTSASANSIRLNLLSSQNLVDLLFTFFGANEESALQYHNAPFVHHYTIPQAPLRPFCVGADEDRSSKMLGLKKVQVLQ
jgi:hypothetical protein